MLSAAKHPRTLSHRAPLWAFLMKSLGLRLRPTPCWDSSLPVVAQNDTHRRLLSRVPPNIEPSPASRFMSGFCRWSLCCPFGKITPSSFYLFFCSVPIVAISNSFRPTLPHYNFNFNTTAITSFEIVFDYLVWISFALFHPSSSPNSFYRAFKGILP